jgi:hypothetical protein
LTLFTNRKETLFKSRETFYTPDLGRQITMIKSKDSQKIPIIQNNIPELISDDENTIKAPAVSTFIYFSETLH